MTSNFGKSYHKSSPYDYNIVRTTRNYSIRDFKYDRDIEDIINVPKYRTKTSLEYSPTSSKNDVIVNRYSQTSNYKPMVSRYVENFSPRSDRNSISKYLYDSEYQREFEATSSYKLGRNSECMQDKALRLQDKDYSGEMHYDFSPSGSRRLNFGSLVCKLRNTRGYEPTNNRVSYTTDKDHTIFTPSNKAFSSISRKMYSRGGFSPLNSKYLNDLDLYQDVSYDNNLSYQPITRDFDNLIKEETGSSLSKYIRRNTLLLNC